MFLHLEHCLSDVEVRASSDSEGNDDSYRHICSQMICHQRSEDGGTAQRLSGNDYDVVAVMAVMIDWNVCVADALFVSNLQ